MDSTARIDRAAIGFSLVCVVHCALLPVAAISLPMLGLLADAEWVHWLFVSLSILAAITIALIAHDAHAPSFMIPASIGIGLLLLALVSESLGLGETAPTVSGAMLLASAHLYRLSRNH